MSPTTPQLPSDYMDRLDKDILRRLEGVVVQPLSPPLRHIPIIAMQSIKLSIGLTQLQALSYFNVAVGLLRMQGVHHRREIGANGSIIIYDGDSDRMLLWTQSRTTIKTGNSRFDHSDSQGHSWASDISAESVCDVYADRTFADEYADQLPYI